MGVPFGAPFFVSAGTLVHEIAEFARRSECARHVVITDCRQRPAPARPTPSRRRKLTIERVFDSPSLNGPVPRSAKLSPDGRYLAVLRNRPDDLQRYDLWAFDRQSGKWRCWSNSEKLGSGGDLSEAEKMQRERKGTVSPRASSTYDWSPDGKSILVPLDGVLYLARDRRHGRAGQGHRQGRDAQPGAQRDRQISSSFLRDNRCGSAPLGSEAKPITPAQGERSTGARPSSSPRRRWTASPAIGGRRRTTASRSSGSTRRRSVSSPAPRSAPRAPRPSSSAIPPPAPTTSTSRFTSIDPTGGNRSRSTSAATRHLSRPRRLGAGREDALRPARKPRADAARHAGGRPRDRQEPDPVQRKAGPQPGSTSATITMPR